MASAEAEEAGAVDGAPGRCRGGSVPAGGGGRGDLGEPRLRAAFIQPAGRRRGRGQGKEQMARGAAQVSRSREVQGPGPSRLGKHHLLSACSSRGTGTPSEIGARAQNSEPPSTKRAGAPLAQRGQVRACLLSPPPGDSSTASHVRGAAARGV